MYIYIYIYIYIYMYKVLPPADGALPMRLGLRVGGGGPSCTPINILIFPLSYFQFIFLYIILCSFSSCYTY